MQQVKKFPHDIHVVKSRRQCGKSVIAEFLIMQMAVENPNSTSYYMSPTYKQCNKVYQELSEMVAKMQFTKKCNATNMQIFFNNGSQINFLSGEQSIESLQGNTVKGNGGILIIDEAAYLADEVFFAIFPYCQAQRRPILMISTPRFKQGQFYEHWLMGEDENYQEVHSFDVGDYNMDMLLTKEKLEFYRKNLPRMQFEQQYLGLFADANSSVFGDFSSVLWNPDIAEIDNAEIIFGIDLSAGTGNDSTVISVWNKTTKHQLAIIEFNDKNTIETIDEIIKQIKLWAPVRVVVEWNSIGKIFYDLLKDKIENAGIDVQITKFVTTNESKQKIINKLQVAIQNNEIKLMRHDKLIRQMESFESKLTNNGKLTYGNAKEKDHDDIIMATAIGYNYVNNANYAIV